jgi:hypothetical protein
MDGAGVIKIKSRLDFIETAFIYKFFYYASSAGVTGVTFLMLN